MAIFNLCTPKYLPNGK